MQKYYNWNNKYFSRNWSAVIFNIIVAYNCIVFILYDNTFSVQSLKILLLFSILYYAIVHNNTVLLWENAIVLRESWAVCKYIYRISE